MIIQTGQHYFEVIENYREAFNQEMFDHRYSEILDRYPYIVGDIGFEQLRLRGFFEDNKKGSEVNKRFSTIQDYLLEYCNFGCAYFVLRRLNEQEIVRHFGADVVIEAIESQEDDEGAEIEFTQQEEQIQVDIDEKEQKTEQKNADRNEEKTIEEQKALTVNEDKTFKFFQR
ncbi:MAG: YutD family protein [Macrococcus canis]|nr:YutD family protein [Macrococcus canis]MEE1107445.1 YutD family protein [Macrococcus canis]